MTRQNYIPNGMFSSLLITIVFAKVCGSTNSTECALEVICRPIRDSNGGKLPTALSPVHSIPFTVRGIGRQSVCTLSDSDKKNTADMLPIDPTDPSQSPAFSTSSPSRTTTEAPECAGDPSGVNYRGNLSRTLSGRTCQNWTAQSPHAHAASTSKYPDAGLGDHNYCRNPTPAATFTAFCFTTDPDIRWEHCAVGDFDPLCMPSFSEDPSECYTIANGRDYRGNLSVSRSDLPCQKWTSQTPHAHNFTQALYPEDAIGDHNFCRNPGGLFTFAVCLTLSTSVSLEFCNIGLRQESCLGAATMLP